MFISVYNLFYTALPVLGLGIFEQDVSDKLSVEYPKLYSPGLTNALFNTKEFVKSVMHGVFSSMILFAIPYGKLSVVMTNLNVFVYVINFIEFGIQSFSHIL
jgi:magnesium-transporting ATPase (P-type)